MPELPPVDTIFLDAGGVLCHPSWKVDGCTSTSCCRPAIVVSWCCCTRLGGHSGRTFSQVASRLALLRRARWRRALLLGGAVSGIYLGLRISTVQHLMGVVRKAYPQATSVRVFPAPLAVARWRYVARFEGEYAAGSVALGSAAAARVSFFVAGAGERPSGAQGFDGPRSVSKSRRSARTSSRII